MDKEKKSEGLPKALTELIEKNFKNPVAIEFGTGDEKLTITVNPMALPGTRVSAIINAAGLVFNEFDGGVEGYLPAFLDFAHRYGVLVCYTDFEVPEELNDAWLAINHTPIYDKVAEVLGAAEVEEFRNQLDELIEAVKQERIHMVNFNRIVDKLGGVFDGFAKQFQNLDINETLKLFENLPDKLKSIPKNLGDLPSGLGGFENIIKTFLDGSGNKKS